MDGFTADIRALCAIAQRRLGLFVFMLSMPLRHSQREPLAMTMTIIAVLVFAVGLGGIGSLAFETPDRDRAE